MRERTPAPPSIPPLAQLAGAAVVARLAAWVWPAGTWSMPGRKIIALLLVGAGVVIAIAGVAEFRRARTTLDPRHPDRARQLVRSGIYRHTRNPMYLGVALMLAGWVAWLGHVGALAVLVGYVVYLDVAQIEVEEAALRKRFGRAFDAYAARVGRWL